MRPRLKWVCPHRARKYRSLGMCNACYLRANGGSKKWYAKNRRKMIQNVSQWVQENRTRRRAIARKSARKTYRKDPNGSILRARINQALNGKTKAASVKKLLGCSLAYLREYLAAQFAPGMSWQNHSRTGWHIDHRKPCVAFDLSDPRQQRTCFHYTNLQPLWARENMSKGGRQ